jgi:hypothetical protein
LAEGQIPALANKTNAPINEWTICIGMQMTQAIGDACVYTVCQCHGSDVLFFVQGKIKPHHSATKYKPAYNKRITKFKF